MAARLIEFAWISRPTLDTADIQHVQSKGLCAVVDVPRS